MTNIRRGCLLFRELDFLDIYGVINEPIHTIDKFNNQIFVGIL
jgi:hypothetical protein